MGLLHGRHRAKKQANKDLYSYRTGSYSGQSRNRCPGATVMVIESADRFEARANIGDEWPTTGLLFLLKSPGSGTLAERRLRAVKYNSGQEWRLDLMWRDQVIFML